jgi:hypothetical protein
MYKRWKGAAWRADSGYKHDRFTTAAHVVRYEQEELGNDLGVTDTELTVLSLLPASRLVWVTRTKREAMKYGTPRKVELDSEAAIIAEDGDGGYLVLR